MIARHASYLAVALLLVAQPAANSQGARILAKVAISTALYESPSEASRVVGRVIEGDTIRIVSSIPVETKLQVETAAMAVGWVPSSALVMLPADPSVSGLPLASADFQSEWPHRYVTMHVFFATDRNITGDPKPSGFFGTDRGQLVVGSATITLPANRRPGEMSSPSWLRLEFRQDPSKHVMLQDVSILPHAVAFDSLRASVKRSKDQAALVFVHGFNVKFPDALRRTAQLSYDLGFDGAAIAYSWPSKGRAFDYPADLNESEWSAPDLAEFLQQLFAQTGVRRVEVIAHSMGSRVLMSALDRLDRSHAPVRFDQVVLAAADIDRDILSDDLKRVAKLANRFTLYASSQDAAMVISRTVNAHPRAGDATPNLFLSGLMDTIDASTVPTDLIGHGYFAESKEVIDDIFQLVVKGQKPDDRRLNRASQSGLVYWALP
jgi:esterase/lipase superfamily enzyme